MSSLLDPENRVVMISGANRGIGAAITAKLRDEGYLVSVGVRDVQDCPWTPDERLLVNRYDAVEDQTAEGWVRDTVARWGRIDALVNVAGILTQTSFEDDAAQVRQMLEVNTVGPYVLAAMALPHLRRTGTGRVVNVASLSGLRYRGGSSSGYAMSKYALVGMSHALRHVGWDSGVRVTALCPGPVATDMAGQVASDPPGEEEFTSPETIAEVLSMILRLPNEASMAVVPVSCWLESTV